MKAPPKLLIVLLAVAAVLLLPLAASATLIGDFTAGTSGTGLAAEALFEQSGNDLQITLTNTGGPALVNGDILTVLFWYSPTIATTPNGAVGYNVYTNPTTDSGVQTIGTHWSYQGTSLYGANQAVTTTGLTGTFGSTSGPYFNATGVNLDGINGGIAASFTGTGIPDTQFPLVDDHIIFHLTLPSTDLITVSDVSFQYGTNLTEPHLTPIPGTVGLLGAGLLGLALLGYRRKRG
jgi:hypothetical protein